jgi:hypothetical protein
MQTRVRDTRTSPRFPRRFKVTFLQSSSYTTSVAAGGFSAERLRVVPPATPLDGVITVGSRVLPFTGRVAWSRPGDLVLNLRGRMGVRFLRVPPHFEELIAPGGARPPEQDLPPAGRSPAGLREASAGP